MRTLPFSIHERSPEHSIKPVRRVYSEIFNCTMNRPSFNSRRISNQIFLIKHLTKFDTVSSEIQPNTKNSHRVIEVNQVDPDTQKRA